MSATLGERIIRLQSLFKTYSGLAFTNSFDRPVAVRGMQNRLLEALNTSGGYGILGQDDDDADNPTGLGQRGLLRRSLLWHRQPSNLGAKNTGKNSQLQDDTEGLQPIQFPANHEGAPTWSWMAYVGEVDFFRPTFGNVDWQELESPWPGSNRMVTPSRSHLIERALRGTVWQITSDSVCGGGDNRLGKIIYDRPAESTVPEQRCLVLGIERNHTDIKERWHYFLMIRPTGQLSPETNGRIYTRIGAGYLRGKHMSSLGKKGQVI
jgi:hypothetical protein